MGSFSKQKGKRGEIDLRNLARECGYEEARRGQQFAGGGDSPDVVGIVGLHVEVKRTETLALWRSIDQAVRDAAGKLPWAVFHRPSRRKWIVVVDAAYFLKLHKFYHDNCPWRT